MSYRSLKCVERVLASPNATKEREMWGESPLPKKDYSLHERVACTTVFPLLTLKEQSLSRISREKHKTVIHTAISPIRANLVIPLDSFYQRRQNQIVTFVDCLELLSYLIRGFRLSGTCKCSNQNDSSTHNHNNRLFLLTNI